MKEMFLDMQERRQEHKLAEILGLSIEELDQLVYYIEPDASPDGLIYCYRVEIDPEINDFKILEKVKKLEDGRRVYLQPYELDEDFYHEEEFEAIFDTDDHFKKFRAELSNLQTLLTLNLKNDELKRILNRQIFIGVISTMETFLSEVFIKHTLGNKEYLKNFVISHPAFRKSKFELREIFQAYDEIESTAKIVMLDTIYHNLPAVSQMYRNTFKIELPSIHEVYKYVMLRHDLVHRNGFSKDRKPVPIEDSAIINLIHEVSVFVTAIAESLNIKYTEFP